jgi:hypothetical protein
MNTFLYRARIVYVNIDLYRDLYCECNNQHKKLMMLRLSIKGDEFIVQKKFL